MLCRFLLLFVLGFISNIVTAQPGDLMVMGVSPDIYLLHTVAPKENWYSIGRLYNLSPKEIAPFNSLTIENPLNIGQQLKVPLTAANFSQAANRPTDETVVPVYHIVQEKEWMFRISTNYNKVPVENLEKWNNISKDQAKTGMKLIVGYLKVKGSQPASNPASTATTTGAEKAASPVSTASTPPPVTTTQPATKNPVSTTPATNPPATTTQAATPPVAGTTQEKKPEPVVKQDTREEKQLPPAAETAVNNPAREPVSNTAGSEGYFKNLFEGTGKSVSGAAGVFKSTSGWQDGKFYALMNNVAVGTVVKVSNPVNKKTVFAKVLGQLPEMKESVGLTARVSDAAASVLGTTATRFSVEVKY